MLIGINDKYQIKQIRTITDTTLTQITVDEEVFKNFSDIKILHYCYKPTQGGYSVYPQIDPKLIDQMEQDAFLLDLDFRTTLLELGV